MNTDKTRLTLVLITSLLPLTFLFSDSAPMAGRQSVIVAGNGAAATATPELPRVYLNTDYEPPVGRTIPVKAGGDLQAALDRAKPGDIITLQPGATFTGNFTLPAKAGSGWIVIRSAAPDASLPPPGTRVTPQHAAVLPKIMTPNSEAALLTSQGAHHYRLIGLEVTVKAGVEINYGVIKLGSNAHTKPGEVAADLIIDRCYVHGNSTGDVIRGIALNSARTAVIDSYISECTAVGFDTQAVCGWNGPGPFKIVNNYLEGSGENFLLGGADPTIHGLVPSDIEFRRNHLYKPLRWKVGDPAYAGKHWTVKNLFELKNAQRILIDGNVMENNWGDAQDGYAVNIKSVNQEGRAPWSVTQDVTFTNNVVRHSGSGMKFLGIDPSQPGMRMQRVLVRNNLWDDIGPRWAGEGILFLISDTPDLCIERNTATNSGSTMIVYGLPSPRFIFRDNLVNHGPYGVKGESTETGNPTISRFMPGAVFTRNIIIGGGGSGYPPGNLFPRTLAETGVVDRANGEFRLTLLKAYRGSGTDGKDIGCDLEAIAKATAGVVMPAPRQALSK